jgi:hypothetical protein
VVFVALPTLAPCSVELAALGTRRAEPAIAAFLSIARELVARSREREPAGAG